jgi:hypothetical protein
MRKRTIIVGHPGKGERSEYRLWADVMLDNIDDIIPLLQSYKFDVQLK